MAVDDNSPKTGSETTVEAPTSSCPPPETPPPASIELSSGDPSTDIQTGSSSSGAKMAAITIARGNDRIQRSGTGGRRKQCRPMRLVCSLIDAVDVGSEDDDDVIGNRPPCLNADYPDVEYRAHSPSDGATDHMASSETDLSNHLRITGHSNRKYTNDNTNADAISSGAPYASAKLDGDIIGFDSNSASDDVSEFPTRYHRLGNELKREMETSNARLEQQMLAMNFSGSVDSFSRTTMVGLDDEFGSGSSSSNNINSNKNPLISLTGQNDIDYSSSDQAAAAAAAAQLNHLMRYRQFEGIAAAAAGDSSDGCAPLDFTMQHRVSANTTTNSNNSNLSGTRHQHSAAAATSSTAISSLTESTSSRQNSSPQHQQQQSQHHHGHHHHHYHHQQQQQHHHHKSSSSSSSLANSSGVDQTSASASSVHQTSLPPHPPVVESEDYCDRCQKHFCNKYYLRKHRQDVHGIAPSADAAAAAAAAQAAAAAAQQQQAISTSNTAAATAAVQHLMQAGSSTSPVSGSGLSAAAAASALPYQPLLGSLPFVFPYQQPIGTSSATTSDGSQLFQSPPGGITSTSGSQSASIDSNTSVPSSSAAGAGLPPSSLLPSLTSLMLLNPFALLNAPSFIQSQAVAAAAGLAAAARMNLTASSSLNTLAELQKSGGATVAGSTGTTASGGGLFNIGSAADPDAPLSLAGLLPPFLNVSEPTPSSLLSPQSTQQQQQLSSGTLVEDFSSSPSSSASSSTNASYQCDLCRKEFCSSYFLAMHRRDKHGIPTNATADQPSSPSLSTASASSQVATAAALAATAAGLQLPPTALSEAIKLLSTSSVNGRSSGLDAVTAAALSAILQPDGVEPGEKVSASAGARSSSSGSAGGKMTSSSSSTPNREHNEKSSRGIFGDQFAGLSLPSSIGSQSVNGPEDVCCLCKKQFPNRYGLVLHLLSAHNVRPEGFGLAGELLQLDGLLGAAGGLLLPPPPPPPPMLSAGQTSGSGSSARTSSRTAPSAGGLMGQGSAAGGSVNLSTGSGSSTLSTSSSKQSDRVSCDICNKEVCNKYFLKTHKIKVHGVYSSAAGSYVLPSPPQQTQQQGAAATNADVKPDLNTGSTSPVDMKSSRLSGNGGTQSNEATPVLKHEEMRKGLMLADSKLNSFAAHLDLALKKDSFGLAGLGLAGLAGLGASDPGLPPLPPLPGLNPPLSASDLFRLFSGAAGKPDDPFGIAAAAAAAAAASFGLTPSLKPQGLPDFGEQLASASTAADGGRSSRSGTSSLSDMSMNLSKHSSSSNATGDRAPYYKESNHGTIKGKIASNSGSNGNSSSGGTGNNASMKHSSSKDLQGNSGNSGSTNQLHLKSSSSSSSLNSSMCGVQTGTERTALTEQELIQSGIDPEAYCEICQKEFCSKYFLRTHRQKIHGVSGPSNTGSGNSSSAGDGGGSRKSSMVPAPESLSSSGVLNSAMAFDPFRSLAAAAAASSALTGSTNPAGAMPLLPLFQGLSLPPFPFGVSPSAAGSLMLPGTDGVAGDNLLGGSGINMTSSGASQMAGGSISRPSGSREAANATRVTCEVCGKELCNKYFLKTHMAKIHGTTVGGHHQQQQPRESSSSRELQQQQLQQSSSNEARQPVESGDNNLSSKLVANVAADVAARIMQHQSTVNSTSGHHDIDLLAPSAFQSLGGVVGAGASTSVSRSSPEMGNQTALAAAATGVFRADHNGNDQQLEPSRRHDQQQHQSSRSQHHHQQQQVQKQLGGGESSADSATVSGSRTSFLDSAAAAAAVSHHRRRSPHEDLAAVAGAELAAIDARKSSDSSPGLRSSSSNNNTERREDTSAAKRKLSVDDQLAASDESGNESQSKVMRFDDRLMSSMPALVPLPVPVPDSSQLFRRSNDCDSTDNANFAGNQNSSTAALTTGNELLQHQLLLAKLASELQSRSASSSLAAAADFNKRLNNDDIESDSSRSSPVVASGLPLSLTPHRTVLAVNGHSTSISPNNELETGTRKSLSSDNQQQPDAGIGRAVFGTANRYNDRIGSGSLSPADLTTAATQLQMFIAPQSAANDQQHPVDFTAAGARTTTPQQAVE